MRILHVSTEVPVPGCYAGGLGAFVMNEVLAEKALGIEPVVLTYGYDEELSLTHPFPCEFRSASRLRMIGIKNSLANGLAGSLDFADGLDRVLHDEFFDLVVFHDAVITDIALDMCARRKVPTVVIVHLSHQICFERSYHIDSPASEVLYLRDGQNMSKDYRSARASAAAYNANVEWQACRKAGQIVVCSEAYRELFSSPVYGGGCAPKRIVNGVDPSQFVSTSPHPRISDEPTIGYIGRFAQQKGFDILLDLMALRPRWNYVICGDLQALTDEERSSNVYMQRLDALYAASPQRIRRHGQCTPGQIADAMAAVDCVVMPSVHEPFGLVALEVMAMQKPLLTSGVDGLGEFCANGRNCLMPEENNVEGYVPLVERLFSDTELSGFLNANAQDTVGGHSWTNTATTMKEIYESLLRG